MPAAPFEVLACGFSWLLFMALPVPGETRNQRRSQKVSPLTEQACWLQLLLRLYWRQALFCAAIAVQSGCVVLMCVVCCWCRVAPGNKAHLSLESAVELARQVGGTDHGFRYIQLPVSAAMPEAWLMPWQEVQQGGSRTLVPLMQAAQQVRWRVRAWDPPLHWRKELFAQCCGIV